MTDPPPRIQVVHVTSPACHWSWGFEAVLQRLKLVYGDQIDITLRLGCPYEDRDQWLVDYGMSAKEASEWLSTEVAGLMGVPMAPVAWETQPRSCMPAVLAVQAARRQDEERAWRLSRELVRGYVAEGIDPTQDATIRRAVATVGLDAKRFASDFAQKEELQAEYEEQASRGPPVHVGFFNWAVWDGGNRRVILDYAFDPREIEGAIDWLSEGKLAKRAPTDIAAYLRTQGLAPLSEIGRVFDLADKEAATEAVETLEKEGKIERVLLAGAPHWKATR